MDNNSNMLQLCRLCLVKDDVNIPIFEEQGDIRQIFLKISSCLPVKVSRDDQLPKKICDGCSYKLDMLYEFWNTSANAEKQLLTWLGEAGMTSQMADGTISAVAQQIKPADAFVKQETIDPPDIHMDDDDDEDKDYMKQEENSTNVEEPPPKRARRTAAVKAAIALDQNSDDDDDSGEPMTKIEDDSEDSDNDDREPAFVDVPSTSADDQPGPSGVGKDGVEAPWMLTTHIVRYTCVSCDISFVDPSKLQRHLDSINEVYFCLSCKKLLLNTTCSCPGKHLRCITCKASEELGKLHACFHKKIKCNVCFARFSSSADLKEHTKNLLERYYCASCRAYFQDSHLCKNLEKQCAFCNLPVSNMYSHFCFHVYTEEDYINITKNVKNIVECKFCDYNIKAEDLEQHLFEHNQNDILREYKCHKCPSVFTKLQLMIDHWNFVHIGVNIECESCGIKFPSYRQYYKHAKKHDMEKLCEFCGKFTGRWAEHVRVHMQSSAHACDFCGKVFKIKSNLRVHMRTHDGVKPFQCLKCFKTFTTKFSKNKHQIICQNK